MTRAAWGGGPGAAVPGVQSLGLGALLLLAPPEAMPWAGAALTAVAGAAAPVLAPRLRLTGTVERRQRQLTG